MDPNCQTPAYPKLYQNRYTNVPHFLGRSLFGKEYPAQGYQHWVISDELVDEEMPAHLKTALKEQPNELFMLPGRFKLKVKNAVIDYRKEFIHKITIKSLDVKKREWVGVTKGGKIQKLEEWWIVDNFRINWPKFFEELYNPEYRNQPLLVPEGRRSNNPDEFDKIPTQKNARCVKFYFGSGPYCAFGNMENLLDFLGDDIGSELVLKHKDSMPSDLLTDKQCEHISAENKHSRFHILFQWLRTKGYQFLKLSHQVNIIDHKPGDGYNGTILIPKMVKANTCHVIAVDKGCIIDGATETVMDLSRDNLNWCCGPNEKYDGVELGYDVKLPRH